MFVEGRRKEKGGGREEGIGKWKVSGRARRRQKGCGGIFFGPREYFLQV
jgi:hypothetical protein